MCIVFIHISRNVNARYKLIILNNRDELFDRPTSEMEWRNGILSGIDEQDAAKGTWFGINAHGKIGTLLSVTQPAHTKFSNSPSRGVLAKNFLGLNKSLSAYCEEIVPTAAAYNGFQFVGLERNSLGEYEMQSVTNRLVDKIEKVSWPSGNHVISNSPPSAPLQKVHYGLNAFDNALANPDALSTDEIIRRLSLIGNDRTRCLPDPQLGLQTGLPEAIHAPLSAIFVRFPDAHRYGTRAQAVAIVDRHDNVTVFERRMTSIPEAVENSTWDEKRFQFKLQ